MSDSFRASLQNFNVFIYLLLLFIEQFLVRVLDFQGGTLVIFFLIIIVSNFRKFSIKKIIFILSILIICYLQYLFTSCIKMLTL